MRGWLLGAMCAALVVAAPQSARAFKDGHELLEAAESKKQNSGGHIHNVCCWSCSRSSASGEVT